MPKEHNVMCIKGQGYPLLFVSLAMILGACGGAPDVRTETPDSSQAAVVSESKNGGGAPAAEDSVPGISVVELCTEPGFLLSRHEPRLMIGKRLPKPCCSPGALGGEAGHRCTRKWPADQPFKCSVWKGLLDSVHRAGQNKELIQRLSITERKQLKRSGDQMVELYANRTYCEGDNPLLAQWPARGCGQAWFDEKYKILRTSVGARRSESILRDEPAFRAIMKRGRACLGRILMEAQAKRGGRGRVTKAHPQLVNLPFQLLAPLMGDDIDLWLRAMQRVHGYQLDRCVRRTTGRNLVRIPIVTAEDDAARLGANKDHQTCLTRCSADETASVCATRCREKLLARYARWDARVEDPDGECRSRMSGMRPLLLYGEACKLFARKKVKAPVQSIMALGLEGHGFRPCMPYVLQEGMDDPEVANFVYDEALGKPNGGLIRRHFVEPGRGSLSDLIAFTEAEARVSKSQEHGFHCMGMHFLDGREAHLRGKPPRYTEMGPWKGSVKSCIKKLKKRARKLKLK